MVCQTLRMALLVGAITAVAVSPVRAHHHSANGACPAPCPPEPCPTAPATRTITVTECVPEYYTVKRTAYRVECRTEVVNGFRTECVPEWREKVVTVVKRVPVVREEIRRVCKTVTVMEQRTVMKTTYQTVQETVMKRELVSRGYWECRTECVPDRGGLLGGLFGGNGHGHHRRDVCADPCADPCATPCPPMKVRTRKVWVNCPQYRECPVTVCKKVCVQVPVVCNVPVCKQVWSEVPVKVCTVQCIPEQQVQKFCVMVPRQVPCQTTRTVRVCVPYEEEVRCCRMVARTVTREVPCAPVCPDVCPPVCPDVCPPVDACCPATVCCETGKKRHGLFGNGGGLFAGRGRNGGCCR